ncbi:MAG: sugar phosphate isomerase/epimerase, partial [Oscillospiraceae bacterium]|nr:sugar phosphate isomerase/epimerase [Oscillospiraceae bacterium]
MRLGGGIVKAYNDPEEWILRVKELGYSAAVSPINTGASKEEIAAYRDIAKQNDVIIAEVGAWSNPVSPDDNTKKQALQYIKNQLALADEIGANCCVNICGARGEVWDGFYSDNYTKDTY